MNNSKVMKAGIGYTIGNLFIKGISFFTVPLFSRLLSTEQFGVYNVFLSYDAIIYVLIGLALHSSIRSANYEFEGEIDEYTSSISLVYILNMIIMLILIILFGSILSKYTGFSQSILIMLVLYSFGSAITSLYNNRISLEYSYKKFLMISFVNSIGNIVISLLFVLTIFKEQRDVGRILGSTVVFFVLSIVLLVALFMKAKPIYKKKYWKFGLKYSLPIVPHGISQVLLAQFDRIMIQKLVDNSSAGIYSLAGNIKLILTIISDSISNVWSTWFYEQMEKKEEKNIQEKAILIVGVFSLLTIGLMAISPEVMLILGGKEYESGKYVAIPMIVDAFVLFIYNTIIPSEYYMKKTSYIMFGTIIAAIINLITNFIFISRYGFIAAAYTTLFSYFIYMILHIVISYKLVHFFVVPVKWVSLFLIIITFVATVNLVFIEHIIVRWMLGVISMLLLSGWLYKKNKIELKKFLKIKS